MESSRYLVIERGSRSIHKIRLVHQNRHLVDEGVAMNKELCRRDRDCHRGFGISETRVEADGVDCTRAGHDRRHRLPVPRRAERQRKE